LPADQRPVVTHQSGKKNIDALRKPTMRNAVYRPKCWTSSTTCRAAMHEADLVICRAGAITVSELTAAGVASVLVPLLVSTTTHQRDNAQWMDKQGRRFICRKRKCMPQRLAEL
jgi:UDP-N-acetylglucosamine--N-acetylmuramyl-(pentapeptide) pyrophosphoryl-undecaprenol N-acetylglucosamine transferase